MSSRFYKALALAIGFEAMLVGSLLCIGSHASTILKAVEAVIPHRIHSWTDMVLLRMG